MGRAPFQVLILPHRPTPQGVEYAVFLRADGPMWQSVSGGGEGAETPLQAAVRELWEETGLDAPLSPLAAREMIPASVFAASAEWGPSVTEIPQHAFAAACPAGTEIVLSEEHHAVAWLPLEAALQRLTWPSNQAALRELAARLAAGEGATPSL